MIIFQQTILKLLLYFSVEIIGRIISNPAKSLVSTSLASMLEGVVSYLEAASLESVDEGVSSLSKLGSC